MLLLPVLPVLPLLPLLPLLPAVNGCVAMLPAVAMLAALVPVLLGERLLVVVVLPVCRRHHRSCSFASSCPYSRGRPGQQPGTGRSSFDRRPEPKRSKPRGRLGGQLREGQGGPQRDPDAWRKSVERRLGGLGGQNDGPPRQRGENKCDRIDSSGRRASTGETGSFGGPGTARLTVHVPHDCEAGSGAKAAAERADGAADGRAQLGVSVILCFLFLRSWLPAHFFFPPSERSRRAILGVGRRRRRSRRAKTFQELGSGKDGRDDSSGGPAVGEREGRGQSGS